MKAQNGLLTLDGIQIWSGGQTGVDQGALDAAMGLGLATGGFCPKGRLAENGPIPDRYLLQETPSPEYTLRTEWNVLNTDGTLLLTFRKKMTGGTRLTLVLAMAHNKPWLHLLLDNPPDVARFGAWIRQHGIRNLNVAGPRESHYPGIQGAATRYLQALLRPSSPNDPAPETTP